MITLNRKELYDLVWTTPLIVLSKKYEISDNGLHKICKKMDIPLPRLGHWQKIAHNKKVLIEKFIEKKNDREKIFLKLRDVEELRVKAVKATPDTFPEVNFHVEEILTNPDKLVVESEKILRKSAEEHNKRNPGYVTLINCYQGLSINVSQPLINRSLCFMDAFIKVLQQRGHTVKLENETTVVIGDQTIQVSLRERTSRQKIESKYEWDSTRDVPNGHLSFKANIGHGKYWNDGKATIERQLPVILQKLENTAELMRIEDIARQERQRERELQEKLRREREGLEDKELERTRDLMSQAIRWHRVTMLRTYIADMAGIRHAANNLDENTDAWFKWANDKADWFDPSINKEDELLKDVNKNTLTMKRQTDSYYYPYQDNHLREEKNFWSKHWWNK